jgi:hypothetical protein
MYVLKEVACGDIGQSHVPGYMHFCKILGVMTSVKHIVSDFPGASV